MKVEQLKAELVVFKGLMSNVSAAPTHLRPGRWAFLLWACAFPGPPPSPTLLCFRLPRLVPHPTPPSFRRTGKNKSFGVLCERPRSMASIPIRGWQALS